MSCGGAIAARWRRHYYSGLLGAYGFSLYDITMNIVGFIPLGFLIVVALAEAGRLRDNLRRAIASTLACGLTSLAIEMSQQMIPGRMSSVIDVATNVFGGLVGAGFAVAFVRGGRRCRGIGDERGVSGFT